MKIENKVAAAFSVLWILPLIFGYWAFVGRPYYVAYQTARIFLIGLALLTPVIFFVVKFSTRWIQGFFTKRKQSGEE